MTSASILPAQFVCAKSVSNLPIDLVVEMVLLRRGTTEGGVERIGRVGGIFEQFELADDWQVLAEVRSALNLRFLPLCWRRIVRLIWRLMRNRTFC